MSISNIDIKLLWGRAAGICSNPSCRADLTKILESDSSYNVGEMAHIIAKSKCGPRGLNGRGSDSYDNLILLCPTCHAHIDKAPNGQFTIEQLTEWKVNHEKDIRSRSSIKKFDNVFELKKKVKELQKENYLLWQQFGPESKMASDPGSNAFEVWELRKLNRIIPNNCEIMNLIKNNKELLTDEELDEFFKFEAHARAFEHHQYSPLDNYPKFPKSFGEVF